VNEIKNEDLAMMNKVERMTIQRGFHKRNNKPGTKQVKDKSK
jgi:hypothetical protein